MKVSLATFGCKVSQYDSAELKGQIQERGSQIVAWGEKSDALVICGCAVTEKAVKEADKLARHFNRINPEASIFFYGCLGAYRQKFMSQEGFSPEEKDKLLACLGSEKDKDDKKTKVWSHTRGFLKVQDGCNHFCSYCIVPYLRGRSMSKEPEKIIEEARMLAEEGFKEIVLTGVHLASYGQDLEGKIDLFRLLYQLEAIPGLSRIRLSSLEPQDLNPEKVDMLSQLGKLCPHLHLPLQSGSDKILKQMKRGYTISSYLEIAQAAYLKIKDLAITTDIMVGFPGETEEDFSDTLYIVKEVGFARVHAFRFSPRPSTLASTFTPKVEEKVKKERLLKLKDQAAETAAHYQEKFLGKVLPVLVEKVKGDFQGEGYTSNYIRLRFQSQEPLKENQIIQVKITDLKDIIQGQAI